MSYRFDDEDACQCCLTDDAVILWNPPEEPGENWVMVCDGCDQTIDDMISSGMSYVDAVRATAGYESGAEPL